MACLRLFTVLPLRPLLSLPRLNSCISRSTAFPALGEYLRPDDFLRLLEEEPRLRDDAERLRELELLLRRERDELERVDELRRVPRCEELRFAAVLRPRERDPLLRDEPLREERLRVDFLVAAM